MGNPANNGESDSENKHDESTIFKYETKSISTVNMFDQPYLLLYTLCVYLNDLYKPEKLVDLIIRYVNTKRL